ncbi:MAG: DUF2071 domain-containing protein [Vulcanimicrobiaceae bacterium]
MPHTVAERTRTFRVSPTLLDMWWHDVCFAHWRADAAVVARALPPGVELDRFAGDAWLSVVPFRMTNVRPRFGPTFPGFASVPEINLRTYVRVGNRAGVWFFSLDAASAIAVRAARLMTALPYFDARIVTRETGGTIAYTSDRTARGIVSGRFRARYVPSGEPQQAEMHGLDAFLHERYRFFSHRGSELLTAEIRHEPWQLQATTLEVLENSMGDLIEHPLVGPPDHVRFGRRLHVRATATTRVARGRAAEPHDPAR